MHSCGMEVKLLGSLSHPHPSKALSRTQKRYIGLRVSQKSLLHALELELQIDPGEAYVIVSG